jgi:hypothetical protein
MPGRSRDTKSRAKRIDLAYFKKLGFIPYWRRVLSVVLVAMGLLWLGWHAMFGSQGAFNAGPLAPAHHVVSRNCAACHISQGILSRAVKDQACLSCHDGPTHHEQQIEPAPSCAACHMDHRGAVKLAQTSDASCTKCHDGLRVQSGQTKFAVKVTRFDGDHPEFAALHEGYKDPSVIKFNHKAHMQKRIRLHEDDFDGGAASKATVQLECADCHRPAAVNQRWPYGQAAAVPALSGDQGARGRLENKAYMAPVTYEKQCQACHALQFDQLVTDLAPHHKTPQEVHEFVVRKFTEYAAAHPHALPPLAHPEVRLPARPLPPPSSASEWIKQRVDNAEDWLWRKQKKGCNECHTLNFSAGSTIPEIVKPGLPVRWFSHAVFDHSAHQMVTCISCHTGAKTSEATSDVLLPGIQTCRECHSSGSAQPAQTGCFECHAYHDWTKEKPVNGRYALHGSGSAARLVAATER